MQRRIEGLTEGVDRRDPVFGERREERHRLVELSDFDRVVLRHLDGTLDRAALLELLASEVARQTLTIHLEGQLVQEAGQARDILRQALEGIPHGNVSVELPDALPPSSSALGWAEGWRGECLHWVETDEEGRLARVKVTDPSFKNWPGLVQAVPGNILPDFPVINKSFNLSYSGNDR